MEFVGWLKHLVLTSRIRLVDRRGGATPSIDPRGTGDLLKPLDDIWGVKSKKTWTDGDLNSRPPATTPASKAEMLSGRDNHLHHMPDGGRRKSEYLSRKELSGWY
ncbi:hypothetical protein C8R44DRAFT_741334 [Mycena epipterygia]|nr:hypothetical protein C8R44DRAFT_741334 [Mycena epipterygia]